METVATAKRDDGIIARLSVGMPKLRQDVWKSSPGPMQGYLTHATSFEDLADELDITIPASKLEFSMNLTIFARLSVFMAFYNLGWNPETKCTFSVNFLLKNLNIRKCFQLYVKYFLGLMTKDDFKWLKIVDPNEGIFEFLVPPPTKEELEEALQFVERQIDQTKAEYLLMKKIGMSLMQILIGEIPPIDILFPEDISQPNFKNLKKIVYKEMSSLAASTKIRRHMEKAEGCYASSSMASQCRPVYRVLQVGAGNGISTKRYLEEIIPKSQSMEVEYVFTDVSPAFLHSGIKKELEKYQVTMVIKKYDMDKDPLEQDFCPGYFDLVLATRVFHLAKDIKKTMKSVRSLLKPGGLILFHEIISHDERTTFTVGLLEEYWQSEERLFKKYRPLLTSESWKEVLTKTGFHGILITPINDDVHGVITAYAAPMENNFLAYIRPTTRSWIIFGGDDDFSKGLHKKFLNVNRKCGIIPKPMECTEASMKEYVKNGLVLVSGGCIIEGIIYLWSLSPETRDQTGVSLPFVTLVKLITEFMTPPKIFAVMTGACAIQSSDAVGPTPGTLVGICMSVANEYPGLSIPFLDLDPYKSSIDQLDELFMNLWVEHKQGAAFRDGQRLRPELASYHTV